MLQRKDIQEFHLFGGLWVSFGGLLEPLSSIWRAGVILVGAFGLPGLSVGSLYYFLWCIWLVWSVCGLSLSLLGQSRANLLLVRSMFSIACRNYVVLGLWSESVRATFFLVEISNALPVPMLRQVFAHLYSVLA